MFRCCPACVARHPSWKDELIASLGIAPGESAQAAAQ